MPNAPEQFQGLRQQILDNQKVIDGLNQSLARKTDEVRIIQEISTEITSTLDLEDILQRILGSMDRVLGFKHAMVLLLEPDGLNLKVAASRGYADSGVGSRVPMGVGVIGVVAKKRKMMRVGNLGTGLAYMKAVKENLGSGAGGEAMALPGLKGAQSQIAIPLLVKDQLIGVFAVESSKPADFDDLDEILITILANQAGAAISNARFHEEEKARLGQLHDAHEKLSKMNESLELKVRQRTGDIQKANEELGRVLDQVKDERNRSHDLLARMAPPEVVPLMLEGKLLARKLKSTILFTDFEGFTQYSSSMEPDELFSKLNHFFSRAGEIIMKYRGYVNKTNGDSVMALFGIPYENASHALDAVLAGLEMQRELEKLFALRMRIGVNSGPITAGILGPRDKSVYDVLGDAVNVASRMEKVCPPGGIAVSEETHSLIAPYFEVRPLGEKAVKGKGNLTCYQVLGIRNPARDPRRVDPSSLFARHYSAAAEEVESFKQDKLLAVDFPSIQARDGALGHNEAVAVFALALLRHLREKGGNVEETAEPDLLALALLHDLGKHALESERLNNPNLSLQELGRFRADLAQKTEEALSRLGYERLVPSLRLLYKLEGRSDRTVEAPRLVRLVVAADIYDALTAPKLYKGQGWTIQGSLEEILRLPLGPDQKAVSAAFAELMKPEQARLADAGDSKPLFA